MKSTTKYGQRIFNDCLDPLSDLFGFYLVTPTLPIHVKSWCYGSSCWLGKWRFRLAGLLIRPPSAWGSIVLAEKHLFSRNCSCFDNVIVRLPVGLILLARFVYFAWGASSGAANTIASDNLRAGTC